MSYFKIQSQIIEVFNIADETEKEIFIKQLSNLIKYLKIEMKGGLKK